MDVLDQAAAAAHDLLATIDATLSIAGAPADDPVWPLLRRVGALPGDLVAQLLASDPGLIGLAADDLRRGARGLLADRDTTPGPARWRGQAAEAFAQQWTGAANYVDQITSGLTDTADFGGEVAAWIRATRRDVAGALADCLGSAEAATLLAAPRPSSGPVEAWLAASTRPGATSATSAARAAASLAAHILSAAAGALDAGAELRTRWAGKLGEVPYQPVSHRSAGMSSQVEV